MECSLVSPNGDDIPHGAAEFNDISKWTSSVEGMFAAATAFNGDISEWDVSVPHGIYMELQRSMAIFPNGMSPLSTTCFLYFSTAFNGDISEWDVSSVTMGDMFDGAITFNGDIWDVSSDYMSGMFSGCKRSAIFPNGMSLVSPNGLYVLWSDSVQW
jgi:hypothetical protein